MGLAIIIPNADFSKKNIGKVTMLQDVAVKSISIDANNTYTGTTIQPKVIYTPSLTNQKGVIWSITSGSEYATIDSSTGELSILSGANSSNVTIKATSTYDSSINADKTITVTYKSTIDELTSLSIDGPDSVSSNTIFKVIYVPENTSYSGVVWSITSGSEYATIDSSTGELSILSGANSSNVTIKATSTHDSSINVTKTVSVTYDLMYELSTPFQGDGASTYVDTGIKLYDTNKNFTIIGYFKSPDKLICSSDCIRANVMFLNSLYNVSPWPGIGFGYAVLTGPVYNSQDKFKGRTVYYGAGAYKCENVLAENNQNWLVALTKNGSSYHVYLFNPTDNTLEDFITDTESPVTNNWSYTTLLCAQHTADGKIMRYYNGIVERLKIYGSIKDSSSILAELKAMYNSVNNTTL